VRTAHPAFGSLTLLALVALGGCRDAPQGAGAVDVVLADAAPASLPDVPTAAPVPTPKETVASTSDGFIREPVEFSVDIRASEKAAEALRAGPLSALCRAVTGQQGAANAAGLGAGFRGRLVGAPTSEDPVVEERTLKKRSRANFCLQMARPKNFC